jgi:aldehyde:ferredoxin oxidoreductase
MVLDWNQPDQLITLIHKIAMREGFWNELAEGCHLMSEKYGGKEFAMHVKGMEVPMHDPRALWSMAPAMPPVSGVHATIEIQISALKWAWKVLILLGNPALNHTRKTARPCRPYTHRRLPRWRTPR